MTPEISDTVASPGLAVEAPPSLEARGRARRSGGKARAFLKIAFGLAVLAGGGYLAWKNPDRAREVWKSIAGGGRHPAPSKSAAPPEPRQPWDGTLKLTDKAKAAMGIKLADVRAQVDPIRLELLGTTEYISDALTKVRPLFKGRVDQVHTTVGQSVKKGDPLVDLFSTELASAKSAYEIEQIQWLYDKNLLDIRHALLQSKTVSQQLYDETKNSEMKNRREYEVARDKLQVYGLSDEEIEKVKEETGTQKARLTLRSPADGLVISRDVVAGNLYDENDTLLVIAPLDRLWVWGNVFESDLELVRLGQSWEISFPFLRQKLHGTVDYISNRVDPGSHAVRIRTSIPNHEGKLKSDMLVRGMLQIPPVAGQVVVPRTAVVVADGATWAFVEASESPGTFERRTLSIVQETDDHAIVSAGLKVGEKVASVGALLLAQMYEDAITSEEGAVPSRGANAD